MASIFPNVTVVSQETNDDIDYGKEIKLELSDGEPVVCEGIEALKIWIDKAIRTTRYRWPMYTWDYGTEIDDLIGLDLTPEVQEREIPRFIRDALLIDSRIKDVRNFIIERTGDKLTVTFTVDTYLGDTFESQSTI